MTAQRVFARRRHVPPSNGRMTWRDVIAAAVNFSVAATLSIAAVWAAIHFLGTV